MTKVFHVYCDGFTGVFTNLSETQAFVDLLRTRGCVGKEIVVNVGHGTKEAATYDRKRERREILKAA
jgi:hypothetical protein